MQQSFCVFLDSKMYHNSALYSESVEIQKVDNSCLFDNYLHLLKWGNDDTILDVGAACGTVTLEILIPRIPTNFRHVVLADISEHMVEFAKAKCEDKRLDVIQMDISSEIPDKFLGYFNHVFSFYCLNCIGDENKHKQAFRNIFDMLKPGGDTLLTIIVKCPFFDVWENMAKSDKWALFMKDVKDHVLPASYAENPLETLMTILREVKAVPIQCKYKKRSYTYNTINDFMNFATAITPFIKHIPEEQHPEYIADMKKEFEKSELVKIDSDSGKTTCNYTFLIACASKPN